MTWCEFLIDCFKFYLEHKIVITICLIVLLVIF
jgi:hypothetical protein